MKTDSAHKLKILVWLAVSAGVVLVFAPTLGRNIIDPRVWSGVQVPDSTIFWNIRLPRNLTAFLAGAGLALSGMAFQAMFRNPLATPFTLGVSSGASLGVSIYLQIGLAFSVCGIPGKSFAAFGGALMALTIVYGLTRLKGGFSSATLLLAGVAISFCFSSLILFIQYISGVQHSFQLVRWLMGSLDVFGYQPVLNMLLFVGAGSLVLIFLSNELNLMMTGEDLATSRGANVHLVKRLIFFAASLMVGGIVAFCGPIGFVGMMVPHICRLIIGSNHRYLMPASLLAGGAFLAFCDMLSRCILYNAEMPVGIVTALLGGPFFLWLLLTDRVHG